MKIKFQNLGSIKEAELDLRPLTVIIGPNNSNKTYIAYSIYGLWECINNNSSTHLRRTARYMTLVQAKVQAKNEDNGVWSLKIDKSFYNLFIQAVESISMRFSGNSLESFFQDSSRKIFNQTVLEIEISESDIKEGINQLSNQKLPHFRISKIEQNNDRLFLHLSEDINNDSFVNNDSFSQQIVSVVVSLVMENIFSDILPLPAERNAFINTYKILANRRYKVLKEMQRELFSTRSKAIDRQLELSREQGDIRYPQPVEDFLDFLSDIELENSPDIDPKNKNIFQKLADQIEEYIQNKNKTKFKNTKFGGKEIKVSVKKGLEIDLYNASSSIKQLAPLLLYLRYRAKVGDFLVIDEPEMNLHPESQVKLLEALSILVNLGVRVLLTTHSPYIMAHLNNIVNGNHDDQEILENQAQSLYLQDSQAFLKMEQVSAYEIKENKLLSLHDPDYGIRWDTLSDVSVDVQQKFFAIYEAGQKNSETNETEEE